MRTAVPTTTHLDAGLVDEQAYFDRVAERREVLRVIGDATVRAASYRAASHGAVSIAARRDPTTCSAQLGGPDDPVAFGRVDLADGETRYVGRAFIHDAARDPLVVSMKAPVADVFYTATASDPRGATRRRTFRTTHNHIDHIDDVVFGQHASTGVPDDAAAMFDDWLLADLARHRTGEMADIAATIQPAQHAIITAPHARLLVVQGGPGTGKTAVALHRLSWMLHREHDTMGPADVLVIGPNPTFIRYVRTVLPALGDRDVAQTDLRHLLSIHGAGGRCEAPATVRLKGDARMRAVLRNALHNRIGANLDTTYHVALGAHTVRFSPSELDVQATQIACDAPTYREGRDRYKRWIREQLTQRNPAGADGPVEIEPQRLEQFVERVWPDLSPRALLRDLFANRERLHAAATGELGAVEIDLLHRPPTGDPADDTFSDADLALIDFVAHAIDGAPRGYRHIVVDEAQDLSPMELYAIKRRMRGGATVVGDVARSTGAWARDNWDDVTEVLHTSRDDQIVHLELGYRVPAEILAYAADVLAVASPGATAPMPVRPGGHEPTFVTVGEADVAATAVERARTHTDHGNSVGVICPDTARAAVVAELDRTVEQWSDASRGTIGPAINLVRPAEANGLEFDAVVVVDPQGIVDADDRGQRMLYVALTRTTTHLDVVHAGDALPDTTTSAE